MAGVARHPVSMRDNQHDSDFSAFMSVCFFEEQKLALVLMEYCFKPELVPNERKLDAVHPRLAELPPLGSAAPHPQAPDSSPRAPTRKHGARYRSSPASKTRHVFQVAFLRLGPLYPKRPTLIRTLSLVAVLGLLASVVLKTHD